MRHSKTRRAATWSVAAAATVTALLIGNPMSATAAAPYPSDTTKPDLISLLSGYTDFWQSNGTNDLHGTVKNGDVLDFNDELAVWINTNATAEQQFRALQDAEYQTADNSAYDQSVTAATALGSVLAPIYVEGRQTGALPLTSALINSSNGSTGAYVGTSAAKAAFSYPRPYVPSDPTDAAPAGDDPACAPSIVNASAVKGNRIGNDWAKTNGDLKITRVPDVVDTTHEFSSNDVSLSAAYGTPGLCTGGSFPSGHTTTAYETGFTLATLLPELAPEILARASEAGNDRIVLGVHYPLDIVGGRIDGEAALAARWSDAQFRTEVLEPARQELVSYLEKQCGGTIASCVAKGTAYESNPYDGKAIPGGTSQIVTDRASALAVYTERMTYGFPQVGTTGLAASVPVGASNLLLTAFPTLTDDQRTSVLAQTEIASGYPLDQSGSENGSWQRLNVAAALSATVEVKTDGSVAVTSTGGTATVVTDGSTATPTTAPTSSTPVPVASGSNGTLANTGLDAASIGLGSAAVLALGIALALTARRRRATER